MAIINKKLIKYDSQAQFNKDLLPTGKNTIADTSIVFIQDTGRIYAHGRYFGGAWEDITDKPSTFAPSAHKHGPITNDGKIGTSANRIIETTTGGLLTHVAKNTAYNRAFGTGKNQVAMGNHTHNYLPLSGGTLTGNLGSGENTMMSIGHNVDLALVKKSGAGGFIGVGLNRSFIIARSNNAAISVGDTFTPLLTINGNNSTFTGNVTAPRFNSGGTISQYVRGDGSLATYKDTTYSLVSLDELNKGTATTSRVVNSKNLNDWLNGKNYATVDKVNEVGVYNYTTSVSATVHTVLLMPNGSPVSLTSPSTQYVYDINLQTNAINTVTGARQVVYYDGTWKVFDVGVISKSSNHPYIEIIEGLPKVRTSHASNYPVALEIRRHFAPNSKINFMRYMGLDYVAEHTHTFASLTSKPTTLSGYGITDAAPKTHSDITGANTIHHTHGNWTNLNGINQALATTSSPTFKAVTLGTIYSKGDVSVLNGGSAQRILTGGLLASSAYADASKIPANGIYSKGQITTSSHGNSSEWSSAYNWGNHSTEGYIKDRGTISGDYNNYRTAGIYTIYSDANQRVILNRPTNLSGVLEVTHSSSTSATGWVFQRFQAYNNDSIYTRRRYGNTWSTWKEVYHTGNFTPGDYVLKTGDTMSGALRWEAQNSKTPFIGYSASDGTFTIAIDGTTWGSGLSLGGGSGNLLWKGNRLFDTSNMPTLTAGNGLTGGGVLNANRTLSVDFGNTATTVAKGDHTHSDYVVNNSEAKVTSVNYSASLSAGTPTAGWYRVFSGTGSPGTGNSVILHVNRSYSSPNNESFSFSINVAYNGKISITQLSGGWNNNEIDKIRVDWNNNPAHIYVDVHKKVHSGYTNTYYVYGSGRGVFQAPTKVSDTPVGQGVEEFTVVQGIKTNMSFYGGLVGNATTATKLQTPWTLTIGSKGKTFDGSANVSWTLAEIGAAPTSHTHSGHDVKTLGHRLTVDSDGKVRVNHSSYRRAGMYGIYDSNKIGHIWSMGNSYQIAADGANFGNLYGLAYKHTNNSTGGTMGGGHQVVWATNGNPTVSLGSNVWTSGGFLKNGSSDSYALLGGGGHIALSNLTNNTGIRVGASGTAANTAVTNPYVKVLDNETYREQFRIIGGSNVTVKSDASKNITITATHRGIQNNLTSQNNTTESLSAHQGYLLANGSARDSTKLAEASGRTNTSLNDIITSGLFGTGSSVSDGKFTYSPFLVARMNDTGWQLHIDRSGNGMSFRGFSSSGATFTTWKDVWHSGNLANGKTSQYIRGDGSLATYKDTTYSEITEAQTVSTSSSVVGLITGRRLKYAFDNITAANATNATNATNTTNIDTLADNATNAARFILFSDAATGNQRAKTDTGLKYNPSSNTITAALTGNASSATKLETTRTIWGRSFDGSANVSGTLSGVSDITMTGAIGSASTTNKLTFNAYDTVRHITSSGTETLMTTKAYKSGSAYDLMVSVLWSGIVTINSGSVSITKHYGTMNITGSRVGAGIAAITLSEQYYFKDYIIIANGAFVGGTKSAFVSIPTEYKKNSGFRMLIADDSSPNDGTSAEITILRLRSVL